METSSALSPDCRATGAVQQRHAAVPGPSLQPQHREGIRVSFRVNSTTNALREAGSDRSTLAQIEISQKPHGTAGQPRAEFIADRHLRRPV